MCELFDPSRIFPKDDVPEFFVHGPRRIELIEGNVVQLWLCRDIPAAIEGTAPMSMPVLRLLIPAGAYVWNTMASVEWGFDRGILQQKPIGPCELRPKRRRVLM